MIKLEVIEFNSVKLELVKIGQAEIFLHDL